MTNLHKYGTYPELYKDKRMLYDTYQYKKQLWMFNVNESKHLYHPEQNSDYRKKVDSIIKSLWNEINHGVANPIWKYDELVIYNYFYEYIEHTPFPTDDKFAGIEELKIFISITDEIQAKEYDAFVIYNSDEDSDIISKFLPIGKYQNSHIQVASIFITLNPEVYDDILIFKKLMEPILYHELMHLVEKVSDEVHPIQSLTLNDINYDFKQLGTNPNINYIKSHKFPKNENDFYYILSELIYYTQNSEIKAHLESTYSEWKNTFILDDKSQSKTYKTYSIYNTIINNLIFNYKDLGKSYPNIILELQSKLKIAQKNMLTTVNGDFYPQNIFDKKYSFIHILKYWQNQIQKYLYKADDIFKYLLQTENNY